LAVGGGDGNGFGVGAAATGLIATASLDTSVILWDPASAGPVASLPLSYVFLFGVVRVFLFGVVLLA
jgi:hypothetical protein